MPEIPNHDDPDAQAGLDHALDVFTAHCEGILQIDDKNIPLKFIHDHTRGRMLASVPVAIFFSANHLLWIPDESEDSLQLILTPEETTESASTDRWQAYHGTPDHVRWATFWIDSARHGPWIFDGDVFSPANPIADDETALCKRLNSDRARLAALCQRCAGMVVPDPVCVGVDPRGIHIRARFGIIRIRFDQLATDHAAATASIENLLAQL